MIFWVLLNPLKCSANAVRGNSSIALRSNCHSYQDNTFSWAKRFFISLFRWIQGNQFRFNEVCYMVLQIFFQLFFIHIIFTKQGVENGL